MQRPELKQLLCLCLTEERAASVCGMSRPCSAQRPGTSLSFSSLSSRPATARPPSSSTSSRPSSAGSDLDTPVHETSDLTHGETPVYSLLSSTVQQCCLCYFWQALLTTASLRTKRKIVFLLYF